MLLYCNRALLQHSFWKKQIMESSYKSWDKNFPPILHYNTRISMMVMSMTRYYDILKKLKQMFQKLQIFFISRNVSVNTTKFIEFILTKFFNCKHLCIHLILKQKKITLQVHWRKKMRKNIASFQFVKTVSFYCSTQSPV